jgi:DTW domain-containing protein
MFKRCYSCFRSVDSCFCNEIHPIDTGIKFVFLMHPKEAFHQKTGTGRLAALSLIDSEIIIDIDFTENERLNELLSGEGAGEGFFPVIMYPAHDAYFTDTPKFRTDIGNKKLMVILVDATWFFARKMLRLSKNLQALPKLSFKNAYRSQYQFKRQPAPECLSTIETAYYLINELIDSKIAKASADPAELMVTFKKMVQRQLDRQQEREEAEAADYGSMEKV